MSVLRLIFCCLILCTGLVYAQGAAYFETKRVEDAAVDRARRMKAAKEEVTLEAAPRDLNAPKIAPAATVSSQAADFRAEPFQFQVVTPQGLIPLEQWDGPDGVATVPPAPSGGTPPVAAEPSKNRKIRLAFFKAGIEQGKTEPEGHAVALGGSKAIDKPVVRPPVVEVTPVAQGVPAKPKISTPDAPVSSRLPPEPSTEDVVAVVAEIPSEQPGAGAKRHLLGFLSGKGLEAELAGSASPAVAVPAKEQSPAENRPPNKPKSSPATKQEAAGSTAAPLIEEPPKETLAGGDREAILNGLGQWLASSRKETFKPAWVPPKYSESDGSRLKKSGTEKPQEVPVPGGAESLDYFAVKLARAPFHVIDTGAGRTHLLELETGTVGRKHGEGDEWTWMQLDSGLMGLMKKRYLRPALENEVVAFLDSEAKSGGAPSAGGREVRFVDVNLPDVPEEEPTAGQSVTGGLSRPAPAITADPKPAPPAQSKIPASSPMPAMTPPPPTMLPSIPLEGSGMGSGGVIAVPSPVPILP